MQSSGRYVNSAGKSHSLANLRAALQLFPGCAETEEVKASAEKTTTLLAHTFILLIREVSRDRTAHRSL